jgi:hypothetical protein
MVRVGRIAAGAGLSYRAASGSPVIARCAARQTDGHQIQHSIQGALEQRWQSHRPIGHWRASECSLATSLATGRDHVAHNDRRTDARVCIRRAAPELSAALRKRLFAVSGVAGV